MAAGTDQKDSYSDSKASLFVSYSRSDRDFAGRLTQAFSQERYEVWIDWEDIPLTAEWLAEIYSGIEAADIFVFVVSPESIASAACGLEIAHAVTHNKRIVPILRRDVEARAVPEAIRRLNWAFFRDSDDFAESFRSLTTAMGIDLDLLRLHTRLLRRAREWESKDQDKSLLLRGSDLGEAEEWLGASSAGKEPAPTPLHTRFIVASRKAAVSRQRTTIGAIGVALVIAVGLSIFALVQRSQAIRQARVATSRELASAAAAQRPVDPHLSLLLAREAMNTWPTTESQDELRLALIESRLVSELNPNAGPVLESVFSSEGTLVLSATESGKAFLWERESGEIRFELEGHEGTVSQAAFSGDGELGATAGDDGSVRVWDVDTGRELLLLSGHRPARQVFDDAVNALAFSPDDRWIASAGADGRAILWDSTTGELISEMRSSRWALMDIAFHPSGELLAAGAASGDVHIWELPSGRSRDSFQAHEEAIHLDIPSTSVEDIAFNEDGSRLLTGGWDGDTHLWSVATGKRMVSFREPSGPIASADFAPGGQTVLTTSLDGSATIWKTMTGQAVSQMPGNTPLGGGRFSPDGNLILTWGEEELVRVWDLRTGNLATVLRRHSDSVNDASFSADGTGIVTSGRDGKAKTWRAPSGDVYGIIPETPRAHRGAWTNTDGKRLVTVQDATATVWDGRSLTPLSSYTHEGTIQTAELSIDGLLAISASKEGATIWDAATGDELVRLPATEGIMYAAEFSPDDQLAITTEVPTPIRIWKTRTGELLRTIPSKFSASDIDTDEGYLNDNGRYILSPRGGGLGQFGFDVVEARTGRTVSRIPSPDFAYPDDVQLSPDGRYVLSATSIEDFGETRVWDTGSGEQVFKTPPEIGAIYDATFSPDSRSLALAGGDGVSVWHVGTEQRLADFREHLGTVESVAFSPNGRWLASAGADGTVRVMEVATARQWAVFFGHTPSRYDEPQGQVVMFSRDGRWILSADRSVVRVYRCVFCGTISQLRLLAEQRIARDLTPTERRQFLHEPV
jgi:WD40 repeat protein